jgi:SNF2 family DNA or RNA helicase
VGRGAKVTHHEKIEHKFPPRENQKVAIDNAVEGLTSVGFHGLLMEMSLGKTKVALNTAEILQHYKALNRVLIVCPKAIQSVWTEQVPEHTFIESEPVIYEPRPTQKKAEEIRGVFLQEFPVLIVRLEAFQKKSPDLQKFLQAYFEKPTLVILDESSKIKNVTTQRAPRLIEYTQDAAYKLILTGTPWTESPLDIFSQMEFLQSGFWYRYNGEWKTSILKKHWYIFRSRYAIMREIRTGEGRSFKTIVGTRRTEEIAKKIQPYVTQQKKDEWLDLPEKLRQTLHVEMGKEQAKAYRQMKDTLILEHGEEILTAQNAAVLLTRLRQIAGGFYPETGEPISKSIAGIDMLLEDASETTGKVVIAASYVAEIQGIAKALAKEYGEDNVCTYYGATKDREGELTRFKESAKFMVLNPQTGAYGLNLQFAGTMYLYSRPFSYEQNAQLEDRIHRPGMKGSATYKEIIHMGSIQEKVLRAIQRKKDIVDEFDRLTLKEYLSD